MKIIESGGKIMKSIFPIKCMSSRNFAKVLFSRCAVIEKTLIMTASYYPLSGFAGG